MSKIRCILSIKEFSIVEYDKKIDYIAIYPSGITEDVVDKAIKHKFESLDKIDYKQIIIVPKEQYDLVLKPQMDILSKYNQSLAKSRKRDITNFEKLLIEKYKVNHRPYTACFCDNFDCCECPLKGKECGEFSPTQMEDWLKSEAEGGES